MQTIEKDFFKFKDVFQDILDIKDLQDWKTLRKILMQKVSKEDFHKYDKNEKYNNILIHTLNVIYCLQIDIRFHQMNERSQEILLWTALFHDCAKLAPPDSKSPDGRDPAHPFRSCHKTLLYLNKLNIIKLEISQLQLWNHLFKYAYCYSEYKIGQIEVHNMNVMPKIILFLEKQVSPFYSTVLKIILMHQCIPCYLYPPVSPIDLVETSLYFNKEELVLLEVFWYNDSYSYTHTDKNQQFFFGTEINVQIQQAKQHLHNHKGYDCNIQQY